MALSAGIGIGKFSVAKVRASSEFSPPTKLPASLDLSHRLPQRSPLDRRLVLVLRAGCSLQLQPHDKSKQLSLPQVSVTGRKGESTEAEARVTVHSCPQRLFLRSSFSFLSYTPPLYYRGPRIWNVISGEHLQSFRTATNLCHL